jgi:hypothetical protein
MSKQKNFYDMFASTPEGKGMEDEPLKSDFPSSEEGIETPAESKSNPFATNTGSMDDETSIETEEKEVEKPKEEPKKKESKKAKEDTAIDEEEVKPIEKEVFSFAPIVSDLVEEGIFTEEEIQKAEIEDSPEGIKNLIKAAFDKVKAKEDELNSLPEDAKKLIELSKEGVDIKQLLSLEENEHDFKAIIADLPDNLDLQKEVYLDYLLSSGASEEKALSLLQKAIDTDSLLDMAEVGANYLDKRQTEDKKAFIESQKEQTKKAKEAELQEYEKFRADILATSTIKGFTLPKDDVTKLHDYMVKPDKNGETGEQKAWKDPENRKLFAWMTMKNFDYKSLEKKIETKKTIELKKKVDNVTDKGLSSKGTKAAVIEDKEENKIPENFVTSWFTRK